MTLQTKYILQNMVVILHLLYMIIWLFQKRNSEIQEKKKSRLLQQQQECEMKQFQQLQKKEYQRYKEEMRKVYC